MRPVDKGSDLGEFHPYNDAQQPLQNRLGEFCSYCERWIAGGIHVEHKKPKAHYGELEFQWRNFLLACGNCNSAKGSGRFELEDYVWPDADNTMKAFEYGAEGRILPKVGFGDELDQKIENTWTLFGLNRHPDATVHSFKLPTTKDKRWIHRKKEWDKATKNKTSLLENDNTVLRDMIIDIAYAKGMFSIWYSVFSDDIDMKRRLIAVFENTAINCFDDDFDLVTRPAGQI